MSSSQQKQEKLMEVKRALNFSMKKPSTPILDTINYPKHMKNLSIDVIKTIYNPDSIDVGSSYTSFVTSRIKEKLFGIV